MKWTSILHASNEHNDKFDKGENPFPTVAEAIHVYKRLIELTTFEHDQKVDHKTKVPPTVTEMPKILEDSL